MFEWIRNALKGTGGKAVAIVVVLGCVALAVYEGWSSMGGTNPAAEQNFVDSATGKPFALTLERGMSVPVKAPSGGNTGYPAERCYWTKDGQIKDDPSYLILNSMLGKDGPTFCPDCGRLVVGHNPRPVAGDKPPPTKEEYGKRGG